ncbi:hypothetical protein RB195_020824 [Necator americanus]|uniref:G-protein coupled receptors family 1 profile domain-containing protein n=1 Tax=Necator americanus TaxID=51031 RepID=A0ABR1CKP9_NECAM
MNYAELDAWNYVFFIFETTLNVLFIPIVCFLFYICITQKNLHVNFRSTLFVTGVGYLICAIHRLILVPTRMCCIAQRSTPFVLSAYQRIFFGLALTLRSQKLDHIMRRETKTMKATANEAPAASNYHNELRAMWS